MNIPEGSDTAWVLQDLSGGERSWGNAGVFKVLAENLMKAGMLWHPGMGPWLGADLSVSILKRLQYHCVDRLVYNLGNQEAYQLASRYGSHHVQINV